MLKNLKNFIAPLLSLIILMLGNALFVTFTSVRLKIDGYSIQMIGYIISAYFAGLFLGSYKCNKLIERVGHIRAYAIFASIFSFIVLMQLIFSDLWMWGISRFLGGICLAGLFISIESWLLAKATFEIKGRILSIYMTAFYGSLGIGQFLLNVSNPMSIYPFVIVIALSILSILPVAFTKVTAPIIEERSTFSIIKLMKKCPLGAITCLFSGLILGAVYGLVPLYAKNMNMSLYKVSYAISLTILGGFTLQYPIGQLSDKMDRRKVISLIALVTATISIFITLFSSNSDLSIFVLLALFGGFAFTIYPLGISHASDIIQTKDLVAATALLSLFYSLGAMVGPIIGSYFMIYFGAKGLFIYIGAVSVILFLYSLIKALSSMPIPESKKVEYRNIAKTSQIIAELDPRQEEKAKEYLKPPKK